MKPQKGKTLSLPIYENGKNWNLQVEGLDNETVNTPLGDVNCVKTRLRVSVDGVLKQTGDVFGWFAESEQSELVKFSADIRIGSIKGILLRRGHISEPLDKSM
jgi:hypothetical protein